MIQIQQATEKDIPEVASFVAELNSRNPDHVTYLSETLESVRSSFELDLTEVPFSESFLLAYDGETLVGVCGMEIDLKRKKGYVWGPWIRHEDWHQVADNLWNHLHGLLKDKVAVLQMAPESENMNCQQFAERVGLSLYKEPSYVLRLTAAAFQPSSNVEIVELNESNRDTFIKLHDTLFPKTYYNANEIIARMSDTRRVFITADGLGYLYCEAFPETAEANLEFVGVDDKARGRGYASALLSHAIEWVFSHETIKEVDLAVYKSNPAFKLYQRLGFKPIHIIIPYEGPFRAVASQ